MQVINPFVINGYAGPDYFCDRVAESRQLIGYLLNGDNVALISPRRMGKTGLMRHCFETEDLKSGYYTFFTDIYATQSLNEFVVELGKVVLNGLKSRGRKIVESFFYAVKSLQPGISFDPSGNPSFNMSVGGLLNPEVTLDEIFSYMASAERPCIVAIDEFQQIAAYPEKNVEAILRTYMQQCGNARFIFAGSRRHLMDNMFLSPSRPFYQSVSVMNLSCINKTAYADFAIGHFDNAGKGMDKAVIELVYELADGITWYMQKLLNVLYSMTSVGQICSCDMVEIALQNILDTLEYSYSETLFRMPEKQKHLLLAIAKEREAVKVTSGTFVQKYGLQSSSSVQSALKGLLMKDYVTCEAECYKVCDRFFNLWLQRRFD